MATQKADQNPATVMPGRRYAVSITASALMTKVKSIPIKQKLNIKNTYILRTSTYIANILLVPH